MLESAVPGNSHAAFGGGRLEKYHPWQLAGPLPNWIVGIWGSHALAEQVKQEITDFGTRN